MTTVTDTHEVHQADEGHAEHAHSDTKYFVVAGILAALTAMEVSTYFKDFGDFKVPMLITLMVVKFVMVVLFFMHLKDDNRMLSAVFGFGLGLASAVYLCALIATHFWQ